MGLSGAMEAMAVPIAHLAAERRTFGVLSAHLSPRAGCGSQLDATCHLRQTPFP